MKRRNTLATEQTHERRRAIYGLDKTAVEAMAERQGGACPLCTEALDFERSHGLHVDHCHNRNVVRGLLCSRCNVALGRWEALSSWRALNASRIDSYLITNENIPMPAKPNRARGRPKVELTPEEIAARAQRKRENHTLYMQKTRAAKKTAAGK